jgi:nucleotide-binding universal stress UspA family protein
MNFRRILIPTDFSDISQSALRYGAELAHDYGAQIIVLYAVESLGPENVTYGEAISRLQPDGYRQRLWQELRQIKSPLPDVQVEFVLSEEDPAKAIIHAAAERQCDLIVVGSHGRGGFKRLFMGSVADEVVRKAPCPVLVVKPGSIPEPHLSKGDAPMAQEHP